MFHNNNNNNNNNYSFNSNNDDDNDNSNKDDDDKVIFSTYQLQEMLHILCELYVLGEHLVHI